ncbi:hypothetical protein [Bradyrhizobium sp. 2S1]|uniref:hypothetical protein n=1 Tax=Bradyrhizobium sp. 2S1 TaxID=1404429 RepID=UPI001407C255|nr:hypothetical protein [Bradyrhizobium sp. 2S1]MCK7667403.1 hypothetical protein [Bradyrhizobium sp. 2S1]
MIEQKIADAVLSHHLIDIVSRGKTGAEYQDDKQATEVMHDSFGAVNLSASACRRRLSEPGSKPCLRNYCAPSGARSLKKPFRAVCDTASPSYS